MCSVQPYHLGVGAGADPLAERELRYLVDDTPPGTDCQREKALADLGHRHTDPLWNRRCARVHGLNFDTLLHGGPLAVGVLGGTPDSYHTAGLERGTTTSTSTRPGQPQHIEPFTTGPSTHPT
jgi:hypothetical protein